MPPLPEPLPTDTTLTQVATHIVGLAAGHSGRLLVGISGPPGAGKSTLAGALAHALPGAVCVPMDGFHYDNAVLRKRGLLSRKGAPETFDADGFVQLVTRLKSAPTVAFPVFDRADDLSRAAAGLVGPEDRIVLVEGNYLLLNRTPWSDLQTAFDLTINLQVPPVALRTRLIERWCTHGLSPEQAQKRALENDIPNAQLVISQSRAADWTIQRLNGVQV